MAASGPTCQAAEVVQGGEERRGSALQVEQHHDGEGEVGDPGAGDAAGDVVHPGPAAHGKHQAAHPVVQAAVQVQQLRGLHRHPVGARGNGTRMF